MGEAASHLGLTVVEKRAQSRVGSLSVSSRYHRLPIRLEDDYEISQTVLGRGCSGEVLLATSLQTGQQFAVKNFRLDGVSLKAKKRICKELEIFLTLDHPHVVRLVDVYESKDTLSLVMECMAGGEISTRLNQLHHFFERDCADLTLQMLRAVNYLHEQNIVHRDLKLENFLFEKTDTKFVKLIDFGFSKMLKPNQKMAHACGTIGYVAPEVIDHLYTSQCDLWSLGVCVFALLFGRMPFMQGMCLVKPITWNRVSLEAQDFVKRLLMFDPDFRLTAKTALDHPWIEQRKNHEDKLCLPEIANSLRNFAQASCFRRMCMSVMVWSLTAEDQKLIRDAFLEMDTDQSGAVTIGEFKKVLEEKLYFSGEEAKLVFNAVDMNHDGRIYYNEFLAAMISSCVAIHDNFLMGSFRRFDKDGSGYITANELHEVLNQHFQRSDVDKIMRDVDHKQDGKIDYQEWVDCICKCDV